MPTISVFYGIYVYMYWAEHSPPHFHAQYNADEALIDIRTLALLKGDLPRREKRLVLSWAQKHRSELLENWTLCSQGKYPNQIDPSM